MNQSAKLAFYLRNLAYLALGFLLIFEVLATSTPVFAELEDVTVRELWTGRFNQTAPMTWSGEMELYLRYQPGKEYPQQVSGVISWSGLGASKTRIQGNRTSDGISFSEVECLAGACGQVVLGGTYNARYNDLYSEMKGKASQPQKRLKGNFLLKRVMYPEKTP